MAFHRIGKNGEKVYGKRGAGILFTDGKRILLLQRSNKGDNARRWGLPGGKSEEGETLLGTAQRETREEIGHLPHGQRIGDIESKNGHHRFKTYIISIPERFECELSDEHDGYEWVEFDKIKKFPLHHKFEDILGSALNMIKKKIPDKEKNEVSGFAEFISLEAIGGATDAILTGKKPKPDTYQIAGAPESMIKPKRKKPTKKKR